MCTGKPQHPPRFGCPGWMDKHMPNQVRIWVRPHNTPSIGRVHGVAIRHKARTYKYHGPHFVKMSTLWSPCYTWSSPWFKFFYQLPDYWFLSFVIHWHVQREAGWHWKIKKGGRARYLGLIWILKICPFILENIIFPFRYSGELRFWKHAPPPSPLLPTSYAHHCINHLI